MPTMIIEFLASHWRAVLIGIVIVGGLAYVEGLRLDNAHLTTQVKTLKTDNKTLTDNNVKLKSAIDVSNKALDAADKAAKDAKKKFDTVQHTITKREQALKTQLDNILHQKDPATCNAAIEFLISNVQGYAK